MKLSHKRAQRRNRYRRSRFYRAARAWCLEGSFVTSNNAQPPILCRFTLNSQIRGRISWQFYL
jgi:hypothetical protein